MASTYASVCKFLIILNKALYAHVQLMATTEKITNVEAYNKYVKKYKSNIQATRQFMADEGVRVWKLLKSSGRTAFYCYKQTGPR